MYLYPMYFTDRLIETIAGKKIRRVLYATAACHDPVINECSDESLVPTEELLLLCDQIPDLVLRTTMITGFPGETDEQFEEMFHLEEMAV